ncbi:putative Transcription initiation factor IIB [Paratrimastix pyriformis]|uniref:General transcription factor TFIIB n=1 Tax=Paratrimastix pyriformis TaxID=342808 RepID=A0ABQ8UHY4_9EUKA|nr:putative Transcription initiation factor IIB [Paratrimastix pyriformis]
MDAPESPGTPSEFTSTDAPETLCPRCHNFCNEDYRNGKYVCERCGLVVKTQLIDTRSEWRTFSDSHDEGNDPNRVGGPQNPWISDSTLSTTMARTDAAGHAAQGFQQMSKFQGGTTSASDRNIMNAIREIDAMGAKMGLSDATKNIAKQCYKEMESKSTMRGRNIKAMVVATVFAACRQAHVSRTFKEVCSMSGVPRKDVTHAYKHVIRTLGLSSQTAGPEQYLPRFCSALRLPESVRQSVQEVAQKICELGLLGGRLPTAICAASLYIVVHLHGGPTIRSAKDIADTAGIAESTLHATYKEIYAQREQLLPRGFTAEKLAQLPVG